MAQAWELGWRRSGPGLLVLLLTSVAGCQDGPTGVDVPAVDLELPLAPGSAQTLPEGARRIELPESGLYLLAFWPTEPAARGQTKSEPWWGFKALGSASDPPDPSTLETLALSVEGRAPPPGASSAESLQGMAEDWFAVPPGGDSAAGQGPAPLPFQPAPSTGLVEWLHRTEPYRPGDPIMVAHADTTGGTVSIVNLEGEVLAVEGPYVLATARGLTEWVRSSGMLTHVLGQVRRFRRHGEPFYRAVLSPGFPGEASPTGQLLVALYPGARSWANPAFVELGGSTLFPTYVADGILEHELAHAWQFLYAEGLRQSTGARIPLPRWAAEGGADAATALLWRRMAAAGVVPAPWGRIPPYGNSRPGFVASAAGAQVSWRGETGPESLVSRFNHGYGSSSWLLMDWALQLSEDAYLADEDVIREILQGALEGWGGVGEGGPRTDGVYRRVRRLAEDGGRAWECEEEALNSILAYAADGMLPGSRYDLPDDPADEPEFLPSAILVPESSPHASLEIDGYSFGYAALQLPAADGGALTVETNGHGHRLRILRVR